MVVSLVGIKKLKENIKKHLTNRFTADRGG
jgi:hypothetical protein